MKKYILVIALAVISISTAQKKELRAIEKLVDASKFEEALTSLKSIEGIVTSSEAKYQTQYHFLNGKSLTATKSFQAAIDAFDLVKEIEQTNKSTKYTSLLPDILLQLTNDVVNYAVKKNKEEEFSEAAQLLYTAYSLDKETNIDYLYFAASSAVNAEDYPIALDYYSSLKDIGYEGIKTSYFVTDVKSEEEMEVDKTTYELYQKTKDFTNFRTQDSESRLPEIIKNMALIYVKQGETALAIEAIKEARAANPKDVNLILVEADLYIQIGDKDQFKVLMQLAIEQDPDNPILYFNLGVINAEQGNRDEAVSYYETAKQLDPTYTATYLNLAALILEKESDLVEQMNSLGNTKADNIKYDKLKEKREDIFLEAIPVLKELIDIDPKNKEALTTLKNIYGTIGDSSNFKIVRDQLEALGL